MTKYIVASRQNYPEIHFCICMDPINGIKMSICHHGKPVHHVKTLIWLSILVALVSLCNFLLFQRLWQVLISRNRELTIPCQKWGNMKKVQKTMIIFEILEWSKKLFYTVEHRWKPKKVKVTKWNTQILI